MTSLLSPQIRAYEAMKAEPGPVSNESWLWDSLMNEVPWVLIILRAESVELKSIRLYLTKIFKFSSELSEPTEPNTANSSQVCLISQSCLRQYRSSLIKIPLAWLGRLLQQISRYRDMRPSSDMRQALGDLIKLTWLTESGRRRWHLGALIMPGLVPVSIVIIVSVTSEWSGHSPLYNVGTLSHHCSQTQNMGLRKVSFTFNVNSTLSLQSMDLNTAPNLWPDTLKSLTAANIPLQSESGGQSRSWTKFRVSLRFCKEGDKRRTSDTCASSARSIILKFMKDVSCECREGGKKWLVSNTWATCASPFIPTPAPGPWFTLLGQFGIQKFENVLR